MRWTRAACLVSLLAGAGCGGPAQFGSPPPPSPGSAPVSLTITDTPPANVTVLSFEVTVTGAVLNPGNVSLLGSPVTVELKRLETDTAYLGTTTVNAAIFNSITLTFTSPSLTFKNDTGSPITVGGTTCVAGAACQVSPTATPLTATVNFPSPGLTVGGNTPAAILVDVSLNNLLSSSLSANFSAGVTAASLPVAQPAGQFAAIEDVMAQVVTVTPANSQFTVQTSLGSFTIQTDSNTAFLNFLLAGCSSANIACVLANQIVDLDLSLLPSGTLLAKNVLLEDINSSESEIEGVVVSLNPAAQQFTMVAMVETPSVAGLSTGNVVTVQLSNLTTFDIDHLGPDTSAFSFSSAADLLAGQVVQVERLSTSSGTTINADRVRLRSSRFTATIAALSSPNFTVNGLPSIFTAATPAITQLQVQTSAFTEFAGTATSFSQLAVGNTVSLRGQLFRTGSAPALVTTKVLKR